MPIFCLFFYFHVINTINNKMFGSWMYLLHFYFLIYYWCTDSAQICLYLRKKYVFFIFYIRNEVRELLVWQLYGFFYIFVWFVTYSTIKIFRSFRANQLFSAPSQLYFFDTLFKINFENLNFFRRKTITFTASPVLTKLKFVILS